jgi:hypothetical protein
VLTRGPGSPQEEVTTGTPASSTAVSAVGSNARTKFDAKTADVLVFTAATSFAAVLASVQVSASDPKPPALDTADTSSTVPRLPMGA